MGSLDVDTTLKGAALEGAGPEVTGESRAGTRFVARLDRDWEIWGPNGGYVAAIALRAAGAATDLGRPASFAGHFVGVADFDTVDVEVRSIRRTRRAESLAVSMTQRGAPVMEALVWAVHDELDGLEHDHAEMPEVPSPDELAPLDELRPPDAPVFHFWKNLEVRPVDWIEDWEARPPGDTRERGWYRFRPEATFADPFLDAARSLLVLDTVLWPAAARGHPENDDWYAPSIDVQARFHAIERDPWLLADACSPVAADGLVGGTGAIWSAGGRLLATGGQQMLCRPRHLNPNPTA